MSAAGAGTAVTSLNFAAALAAVISLGAVIARLLWRPVGSIVFVERFGESIGKPPSQRCILFEKTFRLSEY